MRENDFESRRRSARERLESLGPDHESGKGSRDTFFKAVYDASNGDEAAIPWADLEPKQELLDYLAENKASSQQRAVDIGCGLGDNAEAMSHAGYRVLGFDFAEKAIQWAQSRFPASAVSYEFGNLEHLPKEWLTAFDLVHECYTLQSLPPDTLSWSVPAVASLVAPGGTLLVYTRVRDEGEPVNGPPWPLEENLALSFSCHGLMLVDRKEFSLDRHDKTIPHLFCVWKKPMDD